MSGYVVGDQVSCDLAVILEDGDLGGRCRLVGVWAAEKPELMGSDAQVLYASLFSRAQRSQVVSSG